MCGFRTFWRKMCGFAFFLYNSVCLGSQCWSTRFCDNKADWVENEFNGSKERAEVAYLNNVKNIVKWISTNRPKGQIVWTTSNSYIESLVPGVYRDYQTNQRILRISSAARSYWLEAGFPVLDTFHLTGIACRTRECSQDGGHFNNAVNRAKSSLLLNYYCRPKSCEANNTWVRVRF